METELKFEVDLAGAEAIGRRLGLDSRGKTRSLRSVYFDTPEAALHAKGLVLRVRDSGKKRVQTVKKALSLAISRGEWETEVAGPAPDLKAAAKTPLSALLGGAKSGSLRPAFETRVDRTTRDIAVDGAMVEVALDRGVIAADGIDAPILELELELKAGKSRALFTLARELAQVAPLNLSFASKAARGYALLEGEPLAPVRAADPALARDATAGEAFKAVAGVGLAQIADNARVLRHVRRIEALHQLRVGARRLRSALSLFKPMLADGRLDAIKAELKWLTREFDDARNLDVFIRDSFRPAARRHPHWPGLAAFGHDLIGVQTKGYDRAMEAIGSERFRGLMLETAAWIDTGPWTSSDDPVLAAMRERPVKTVAAEILEERRRKIAKKGRKLAELEPRPRHKLRINTKKLRYACGFFGGLYSGKPAKRLKVYEDLMGDLQDGLGAAVDISAAESLIARLAIEHGTPELALATGLVGGERQAGAATTLKAAEKAFRRFKKAKPFW
ncbi:MAG TPA: CHAD domain-containing protein [Caulobacteraceae bacterium]